MAEGGIALTMAGIIPVVGFMFVSSAVFHAQADDLTLIPPAHVPASGTFYSIQRGDAQPPFPFNPFPELSVYSLGEGISVRGQQNPAAWGSNTLLPGR